MGFTGQRQTALIVVLESQCAFATPCDNFLYMRDFSTKRALVCLIKLWVRRPCISLASSPNLTVIRSPGGWHKLQIPSDIQDYLSWNSLELTKVVTAQVLRAEYVIFHKSMCPHDPFSHVKDTVLYSFYPSSSGSTLPIRCTCAPHKNISESRNVEIENKRKPTKQDPGIRKSENIRVTPRFPASVKRISSTLRNLQSSRTYTSNEWSCCVKL